MKKILCIFLCCLSIPLFAKKLTDYTVYHRNIIKAEDAIFIKKDPNLGLKIFKSTFDHFDFVFMDNCIEAFELAAFYKKEDYEMFFIKKALENGFELQCLNYLKLDCQCNLDELANNIKIKVTVFDDFVEKNRTYLENYAEGCYDNYIKRIDKDLLNTVLKHHVKEQLFKDCPECDHTNLGADNKKAIEANNKKYQEILDEDLVFIETLAKQHIFPGERNLGIYTDKLAAKLDLPIKSIEAYKIYLLDYYNYTGGTKRPANKESDSKPIIIHAINEREYFENNSVYLMLFQNPQSYITLFKYKDEAIKNGYWHPREFASLMFNTNRANHNAKGNLRLEPDKLSFKLTNTKEINKIRDSLLLPSYEIDYYKHQFAHEHNLKLQFGHLNGTQ